MRRCRSVCVAVSFTGLLAGLTVEISAQGVPGAPVPGVLTPAAPGVQPQARDRRPGENERGTAAIRGQVVAADTGTPLRRVQVRAFSQTGGGNGLAQTDAQGRYEITQLPAGRYFVSAMRSGYVNLQFGQKAPNQPGTPIEIADGQALDKVNFALPRGGAISGRVVDELGEPVASVEVHVQRFGYMGGARRLMPGGAMGGNDRTDDLGQFRLYGLPPGEYYVSATLRSMEFMGPNAAPLSGQSDGYASTYFPGTTTLSEARRITVRAGQDVTNVSFALVSARLGRISGRVTNSSGQPYADGMLMVAPRNDEATGLGFNMTGTQVRGDGTFQTAGLPPGTYSLIVQPRGGPMAGVDGEVARLDVPVNGEDVNDVFIVTGRAGIIRGRLVADDGSVLPFRPGQVRIFAQPRDPGRPMMGMRPSVVRDDWTFEVSGLTEAVRLNVGFDMPGGGWSIRHAWKDNVDLLDTPVDIAPGQTIEDVELVATQKATELSGLVNDSRNQPVTDASVVVFSEDKERWTTGSRYLRMTRPDTNGKYTVRLTPSQNYRVVVVQGLEDGQFSDPEFLTRALEYATPFDIGEGEGKVVNLKLVEVK
jgi:Carboxypeptidase regulatory-like domain